MDDYPNLDCMDIDDLRAYCRDVSIPKQLREYADCKVREYSARIAGRIGEALKWEGTCDMLYRLLPVECRW